MEFSSHELQVSSTLSLWTPSTTPVCRTFIVYLFVCGEVYTLVLSQDWTSTPTPPKVCELKYIEGSTHAVP